MKNKYIIKRKDIKKSKNEDLQDAAFRHAEKECKKRKFKKVSLQQVDSEMFEFLFYN